MPNSMRSFFIISLLALSSLANVRVAVGEEIFPGRVHNPPGNQITHVIEYSSGSDEYLLAFYGDGLARVGHLSIAGVFTNEIPVPTPTSSVNGIALAYNSVDDQYLLVTREDDSTKVRVHFLDADGNPLGASFSVGTGGAPNIAYSPDSGRYFVVWDKGGLVIRYAVVDADSTNPAPVLATGSIESANSVSSRVVYGTVSQKFLIAYSRDDDIYGKFASADGLTITPRFPIDTASQSQNGPVAAYHAGNDRFIIGYQGWLAGALPDLKVSVLAPDETVTRRFKVVALSAWEVVQAIVYNEITNTVVFAWRHSGDVEDARAREWEVGDGGARALGSLITLSDDNPGVHDGASRNVLDDPQVTFVWGKGAAGSDGIHAGIVHVTPPPPDLTPPGDVTDLAGSPGGVESAIGTTVALEASNANAAGPIEDTTDGVPSTFWSSGGNPTLQDEWITWDLQGPNDVGSVELFARNSGNLFPIDYRIELSLNNTDFDVVANVVGASVSAGASTRHAFPFQQAQYVRLYVTQSATNSNGKFKVEVADVEISETEPTLGTVDLTWTAPGDDDHVGAANTYHLVMSEDPILNDGDFNAADPVPGADAIIPQLAGNLESFTPTGLPDETTMYFALKTEDENSNVSGMSNVASVNTPGIAPAAISNLAATSPNCECADLTWTATGDDGAIDHNVDGSYDVRWSLSPITAGNFVDANIVALPAPFNPKPPGSGETLTVNGLPPETTIYFAIKVSDELGNTSDVDTSFPEPVVTTFDLTPPAKIFDLRVGGGGAPTTVAADASDASGEANPKGNATDDDLNTFWATPTRNGVQEFITLDTGAERTIVQVKLTSRAGKGDFFPEDVEIQLSNNPTSDFVTVMAFSGLADTDGAEHVLTIPPTDGQYVRVLITKPRKKDGKDRVQIAEIEILESVAVPNALRVLWTAPGDNGDIRQAASYDLRWSEAPITDGTWDTGAVHPFAIPTPLAPGLAESALVTGLPSETTIYFAITASDEIPLTSIRSDDAIATTLGVAPDPIDDFASGAVTGTTVFLSWSATGDDGSTGGPADEYDVRVHDQPITDANFDLATEVDDVEPTPLAPGTFQDMTVTGLDDDTLHYFAIQVIDDVGNRSPIHTNGDVMALTPDVTPPAQIALSIAPAPVTETTVAGPTIETSSEESDARAKEFAIDGKTGTFWASLRTNPMAEEWMTLDLGSSRIVSRVEMLARNKQNLFPEDLAIQVSEDNLNFTTVREETGLPSTTGLLHTFSVGPVAGRYLRILITKTRLKSGTFGAQVAEISVYEAAPDGALKLSWTSPGDDPGIGSPASYDLRSSPELIDTELKFTAAADVTGEPAPLAFGLEQSMIVVPDDEGVLLHFAIKAQDDSVPPNVGPLSNDVSITTTVVPPAAVTDLAITRVTSNSIELTWKTTGDSGFVGTADEFIVKKSTTAIVDDATFDGATTIASGVPSPEVPYTMQSVDVTGLDPSQIYYFAIKVEDETDASSPLSNVVSATTDGPDSTAPGAITGLGRGTPDGLVQLGIPTILSSGDASVLVAKELAIDTDPATYWGSTNTVTQEVVWLTLDLGVSKTVSRVRMLSRNAGGRFPEDLEIEISDDNIIFDPVTQASGLPATNGMWHTFDFGAVTGQYVRILMTKTRKGPTKYGAHVAEVEIYSPTFSTVSLTWLAPGDDLDVGTASAYELRWSNVSGQLEANFTNGTQLTTSVPQSAGATENLNNIPGLPAGTLYFAIRAEDEVPNVGPVSGVITVEN